MNYQQVFSEVWAELGFKVEARAAIATVALLVCRVAPVFLFSPFIGGEVTPSQVRLGVSVLFALVLFPAVAASAGAMPLHPIPLVLLFFKEVFIGYCLAWCVGGVMHIVQSAGQLADNFSGANMAQMLVPQLQQQVSLLSAFKVQLTIAVFLTLGGYRIILDALVLSVQAIPVHKMPELSNGLWAFTEVILRDFGNIIAVAAAMAGPVLVSTFLTDLALGMINRVAPQVQVFFISMQVKPLVGTATTFAALGIIMDRFLREAGAMDKLLLHVVQGLK